MIEQRQGKKFFTFFIFFLFANADAKKPADRPKYLGEMNFPLSLSRR